MIKNERIIQAIFSAINEVNHLMPDEKQLEKSVNTALSGTSSELDSLGLVNLIIAEAIGGIDETRQIKKEAKPE